MTTCYRAFCGVQIATLAIHLDMAKWEPTKRGEVIERQSLIIADRWIDIAHHRLAYRTDRTGD